MAETLTYTVKTLTPGSLPPAELVNLITDYFHENIPDQAAWDYYFRDTVTRPPYIIWLEHLNTLIAHYSMFYYDFVSQRSNFQAGKPELPCVTKSFLQYCIKNKINYAANNPIEKLNQELFRSAEQKDIKVLFTWPNDIALNTYQRQGYTIHPLDVRTFRYYLSSTPLIDRVLQHMKVPGFTLIAHIVLRCAFAFLWLWQELATSAVLLFKGRVSVCEISSFAQIPLQEIMTSCRSSFSDRAYFPKKDVQILDKRFATSRFRKLHIMTAKQQGYIVLNIEPGTRSIKIADHQLPPGLFLPALLATVHYIRKKDLSNYYIDIRNYDGLASYPLAMFVGTGFLPGKKTIRNLAWKTSIDELTFMKDRFYIDDFLSDYSIF